MPDSYLLVSLSVSHVCGAAGRGVVGRWGGRSVARLISSRLGEIRGEQLA